MNLGLYDLLDAGVAEPDLTAWLGGRAVPGLPSLSPKERRAIGEAWWFWARPGQRWEPGPEFITDFECGRGFGKDYLVSQTICQQAALDPGRWGGYAIVVGPDPTQVKRDCLFGPSGCRIQQRPSAGWCFGLGFSPQKRHRVSRGDEVVRRDHAALSIRPLTSSSESRRAESRSHQSVHCSRASAQSSAVAT
jgi:hypothetical protein